tara:strand:+ start:3556 stop:4212 length:657 start_codon:yes stop_codon:yes gene_type:complete
MYTKGLLIIVILFLFFNNQKIIEPINTPSICGGLRNSDINYRDPNPPFKIRRCLKGSWSKPGTSKESPDCCDGIYTCKPTDYGGYCESRDKKKYIYDMDELIPYSERKREKESKKHLIDDEDRERILKEVLGDIIKENKEKHHTIHTDNILRYLNYFVIFLFVLSIVLTLYYLLAPSENDYYTEEKKISKENNWFNPKETFKDTKKISYRDKYKELLK